MAFSKRIARLLALSASLVAPGIMSAQSDTATGPAVGEKIPSFTAVDQNGQEQTLESLRGPNGLLLLFHRSADW